MRRDLAVGIIGAGPRGTSVAERLLAHWQAQPEHDGASLTIRLIDPYQPGSGHVWQPEQSRLYLMNTPALFPTVVPAGEAAAAVPPSPVPYSFDAWRELARDGGVAALSAEEQQELRRLGSADFPSRAIYGRYLRWLYARLEAAAGPAVDLIHHRVEAVDLEASDEPHVEPPGKAPNVAPNVDAPPGTDPGNCRRYTVTLGEGTVLELDTVVLALGHLPALLTPEQQRLQDDAQACGLRYWPPAPPGDVDWDGLPEGEPVLVRGLGLNFFDVMIQVTEGRGGTFVPRADGQLHYRASGREPVLIAASRRGVPYRAKAKLDSYIPRGVTLHHLTPSAIAASRAGGVRPTLDHDLWPLLHRDVLWAYYSTLVRTAPAAGAENPFSAAPETVLQRIRAALDHSGPGWAAELESALADSVPVQLRLDVEALAHPFAQRKFAGSQEYCDAVVHYLDQDAAGSARGEDDPLKMAIGALNASRSVLKQAVADGGITDASWLAELRGWFEPLVEGLASGPPAQRIAQLAALARAGVVRFVGPRPKFSVDTGRKLFTAVSPWVAGEAAAGHLVEAMTPPNRVESSTSVLVRRLLERGLARARIMMFEDGVPVPSPGFDVTNPPYRLVGASGSVEEGLYVIGLQLSSVQWGTAIAAEAGAPIDAGGRTLRDADDIARAILSGHRSR
jgi:hypothetical protein